jgi:hypothetical protein
MYDQNLGGFLFEPFATDLAKGEFLSLKAIFLEIAAGTGIGTLAFSSTFPAAVTIIASATEPGHASICTTQIRPGAGILGAC